MPRTPIWPVLESQLSHAQPLQDDERRARRGRGRGTIAGRDAWRLERGGRCSNDWARTGPTAQPMNTRPASCRALALAPRSRRPRAAPDGRGAQVDRTGGPRLSRALHRALVLRACRFGRASAPARARTARSGRVVRASITAVAAAKAAVCVASSLRSAIQVGGQLQRQRREPGMAVRAQQLPRLDAKGASQPLQFVDPGGHHRAADAVQRAVGHAAARRDLRAACPDLAATP